MTPSFETSRYASGHSAGHQGVRPVFRSFADVARAISGAPMGCDVEQSGKVVARSAMPGDPATRAWNTYSGGSNGGYLLDFELARQVWDKARSNDGPLNRCLFLTTKKHSFYLPAFDETTRANGGRWGGIQAYWTGQKDDISWSANGSASSYNGATQPAVDSVNFSMQRCVVYSQPFSNDLLDDSDLVEGMLDYAASQELQYAIVDKMINGLGEGEPLGVVGAPCSITVSRNTPSTIKYQDVDALWARLWPFCRRNAVFLCNDETLGVIDAAATSFNWPLSYYEPQGGPNGNPYPLMKGRPLLPTEQSPALGSAGDLICGDFSQYMVVASTSGDGGMEINCGAASILAERKVTEHKRFGTDEQVFRFKVRLDGRPMWRAPVTVATSASPQTNGPFTVLR